MAAEGLSTMLQGVLTDKAANVYSDYEHINSVILRAYE